VTSAFSSLHESLQQVLAQRLEWTQLREVQEQTYAAVVAGNDVLVIAPTAGGKSEAALIPVMDDILKNGRPGVTCLYISPLKALINDQEDRFRAFCIPTSLSVMKWHGDVAKGDRSWKEEPPHFLMITPESLEVLLQEKTLSADLKRVRYIIIDELHAFVESERGVHLKVLLERMDRLAKRKIQRIGLSATTGNPGEILSWLSDMRHGEELVTVSPSSKEKHFRFIVEPEESRRIDALVRIVAGRKALVFVNSRSVAELFMQEAAGRVQNLHIHHSSLAPATRKAAEEAFSSQAGACIICTSTLELGIDIGDLDVVVQVGPPNTVSSFLQRMGRSGRREKAANVVWIVKNPCELLCCMAIIECAMEKTVEVLTPPKKPYNVLLQQLFLLLHRHPRVSRREVIRELLSYPVFGCTDPRDMDLIIRHLILEGFLATDGEMLMPGTEAERVYGRSNWKDLYSVISGGGEYRAVTPEGDMIGKLDAKFVNSRENGEVTLGGQSWSMVKCDEGHNIVVVVPGGTERARTFWTGSSDEGYSPLVCHKIREIGARGGSILPLGEAEQELLGQVFARLPFGLEDPGLLITERKGARGSEVLTWSFGGSQFNRVLSFILTKKLGGKANVRYNDFIVKIPRAGKEGAGEKIRAILESIRTMERQRMVLALPPPLTDDWKFARVLPRELLVELAASDYYHVDEFIAILDGMEITLSPAPPLPPPALMDK
jgi:ATP-dependent Lhr-like helicase